MVTSGIIGIIIQLFENGPFRINLHSPVNPMRLVDDPSDVEGGKCVAVDEEDRVSPMNWLAFGRPESAA